MRVSVLLSPTEARRFSSYCKRNGHKKSTLIAKLVTDHMNAECFEMSSHSEVTKFTANRPKKAGSAR